MGEKPQGRTRLRRFLRRMLWLSLAVVTVAAGALAYLHLYGLSSERLAPLLGRWRARGFDIKFTRVYLRGLSTLIARDVHLTSTNHSAAAAGQLSVSNAQVQFRPGRVRGAPFHLSRVTLHQADLLWLFPGSEDLLRSASFQNTKTELRFLPDDRLELAELSGSFQGAQVRLTASITNASGLPALLQQRARTRTAAQPWPKELEQFIQSLQFARPAAVRLHLTGDAHHPTQLLTTLDIDAPQAHCVFGVVQNLKVHGTISPAADDALSARLTVTCDRIRAGTNQVQQVAADFAGQFAPGDYSRSQVSWEIAGARVDWGIHSAEKLRARGESSAKQYPQWQSQFDLALDRLGLPWVSPELIQFRADVAHTLAPPFLNEATWRFHATNSVSFLGRCQTVELSGHTARVSTNMPPDAELAWWNWLAPFPTEWRMDVRDLDSPKVAVSHFTGEGTWLFPTVHLKNVATQLYDGSLEAEAHLTVTDRRLTSTGRFNFDVHKLAGLLTPDANKWLRQFTWTTPPNVRAQAGLILPPWTDRAPKWKRQVLPTVILDGDFQVGPGTFRTVPASSAQSHFTLTNYVWHLPDLLVTRPEGEAALDYTWSMRNQEYHWRIISQIDPTVIRPLIPKPQQMTVDFFSFQQPPRVVGEVWGQWQKPELVRVLGTVEAANLSFRGQPVDTVTGRLHLTNLVLHFSDAHLQRGTQEITVQSGAFNIRERALYITNGLSTFEPHRVTRVITPEVHRAIEPYVFHTPPTVRLDGKIPTGKRVAADARFEVAGHDFRFWKFRSSALSGRLHWQGDHLSISNLLAEFYGGELRWSAEFDFTRGQGADLQFRGRVSGTDLQPLMRDLRPQTATNRLEGKLNSSFVITSAKTSDPNSWDGSGYASLDNGILWSIPVFGFFSPVLNAVKPGLGSSRIHSGSATFIIDDSVVHTKDLTLRSPLLRLQYSGMVDLAGHVEARLRAEILRDTWVFGELFSVVLRPLTKALEYRITGTVNNPASEPVYIPKLLLFPFHPLRTLRALVEGPAAAMTTEPEPAPPAKPRRPLSPAWRGRID